MRLRSLCALAPALILALTLGAGSSFAQGKKPDREPTQKDFSDTLKTELNPTGAAPAGPGELPSPAPTDAPTPVSNLSDDAKDALNQPPPGTKMILGSEWRDLTPEQREARLRDIRSRQEAGTVIVITVPKGEVWVVPRAKFDALVEAKVIKSWTQGQVGRLPADRSQAQQTNDKATHRDKEIARGKDAEVD